ncbi:MAG: HIT domain-containing protein [Clostridiales bacterium]|jgi:diadenosine tetraphosphate (Ap4A) HIT family hydrolase|nr:HIT domain-containing protein [Clostridiales bacterium]
MKNCLFCKFIDNTLKTEKVYEDERMIVIRDIAPKARLHYLMIPKDHYAALDEMDERQQAELGKCLFRLSELKEELDLGGGYRLIVNQGADAGQTVGHLHVHILGGQELPFDDVSGKEKTTVG